MVTVMMTPYWQSDDGAITIYNGDCLDVLRDGAVKFDSVIGDPPYCSGGRQQAGARNTIDKSGRGVDGWFLTDNMGGDSYIWWMREIAGELFRFASNGAHCYLFTDWRQYTNVVTACETKGWALRGCVVWDKDRGGAMGSFWRNNHEWIPVFSKGSPAPLPHGSFFNTWRGAKPQGGEHPTAKPEGLVSYLCEAAPGTILDPWMGSGTTLRAARKLGRKAIGIESDRRYCDIAIASLGAITPERAAEPAGPLFSRAS